MKQFALLVELDEYRALTVGNCAGITGELFVNEQTRTLAETGALWFRRCDWPGLTL